MAYFILGRSGSGKTEKIHEYIKGLPEGSRAVFLVPEQSSFQSEKKILASLGAKKAKNIEVLSFRRLCSVIFDQYQGITEKRIDDGIKAVLMSMAIENAPSEGGELELYGDAAKSSRRKTDLVEPMLTAVNEYKMCLITPERLMAISKTVENRVLASKLRDSARIYAAYNALLGSTYADPDDDLTKLYHILCEHQYFSGMYVFVDSFSGFSAQELRILECIISQADDFYISICCERSGLNNDSSLFAEPNGTYRKLLRICQKAGKKCNIVYDIKPGVRFLSDPLKVLEEGLFAGYRSAKEEDSAGYMPEPAKNDGSVGLYEASDIYDEISAAAENIFRLVNDEGYHYSDIEIIAGDLSSYKSVITAEFPKYSIPYFLSDPQPLEAKPLFRLMLSAFEVIHSGFDTESVLRFAKTGLTPLDEDEIFRLENYAYVWSIRGKRWKNSFTMSPNAKRSDRDDEDEIKKEIDEIEQIRSRLISPLLAFEEKVKAAENGGQLTQALYELTEALGTRNEFRRFILSLQKSGGESAAEREAGVWDTAMNILDKMYSLLENKSIDSKTYYELFRLYIRKSPLSDIPRTVNSVTVGEAGNIRSANPRAVFVIGAVQSVFPAQPGAFGIFTDSERRQLRDGSDEDKTLPLYDSVYGNSLKEKFNVYTALTAARERLYVSWYTQSLSGAPCEPSVIKSEILSMLPDTEVFSRQELSETQPSDKDLFFTERQGFDICARLWNSEGKRSYTLKNYYLTSEEYRSRTEAVRRAAGSENFRLHDFDGIKWIYGSPIRLSSTKLDKFAACKFSYFCQYGLDAQPLRKAAMDSGLYGSAMHYIFERIFRTEGADGLRDCDDKRLKALIKKYLNEYVAELGDEEERTERFSAACRKIRKNAFMVLGRMRMQLSKDSFRPVDFELRIGSKDGSGIPSYEVMLPTGDKILVTGYVDRVDTADIGENKYIRIMDYKTGTEDFKMSNVANGIKVQMLLYLSAILKNGTKKYSDGRTLLPAGVLYVPSTAKSGARYSGSDSEISAAIDEQNKNFKMKGLLIDDEEVLRAMESDLGGEFIPVKIKTNGEFYAGSSIVSAEDMEEIFRYVDICIKRMGIELYSGSIEALPEKNACTYCEYGAVCRFEKGGRTLKRENLSSEGALTMIKEVTSEEEVKKNE